MGVSCLKSSVPRVIQICKENSNDDIEYLCTGSDKHEQLSHRW